MMKGAVPQILAKQEEGGYWTSPTGCTWPSTRERVQLIILAEHMATERTRASRRPVSSCWSTRRIMRAVGSPSTTPSKTGGGRHSEVIPCLTGNMVWSLISWGI